MISPKHCQNRKEWRCFDFFEKIFVLHSKESLTGRCLTELITPACTMGLFHSSWIYDFERLFNNKDRLDMAILSVLSHTIPHGGAANWSYCALEGCHCSLPKVCLLDDDGCARLKVCSEANCDCDRPKVCKYPHCRCDRPKVITSSFGRPINDWSASHQEMCSGNIIWQHLSPRQRNTTSRSSNTGRLVTYILLFSPNRLS
jgi:hypothetical protein